MDLPAISSAYKRWAPIYDETFGLITRRGRARAVRYINGRRGRVLEVGVGTGLSLPDYGRHLEVTGIDFSHEMLAGARKKVEAEKLDHVAELRQMDARRLDFPDDHFDTVVAMYLVSVVPEPERVVREMARVCRPGGEVVIVNHFARDEGVLAKLERMIAPLADHLGWHPDFELDRVLSAETLRLEHRHALPPFGLFTFLRLRKEGAPVPA
ncbi:class I SAM-dependent methyltransferase [Roseitranquillus sediminis]|uniref:class I SAM-dependent methyltransferase n=1 Tax=Roseitranquillus sediminis TaxID=2809051 RepID=UPI001D0C12D5|nr:class I SAM-dependent methyltransferase [Roseitranquillus sediminis]MBM9595801.1 class I SAM-dependent methyltransferase [Roseitranquillus sediminis]